MQKPFIYITFCCLLLAAACKKDAKLSEPQNRKPGDFTLVAVKDKATDVDLHPTFSWEPATDPDGDRVTYTIYLSTENEAPTTKYKSGISGTSFTPVTPLQLYRKYNWKVVADDGQGGQVVSPVFSFTTKHGNLKLVARNMNLMPRADAALVVFNGKMVIIGGFLFKNEKLVQSSGVYGSSDGINWSYISEDHFGGRSGHTALVFKDKIWMIGGRNIFGFLGEVWSYGGGNGWERVRKNLIPRFGHKSLVYDDKMWIIGGYTQKEGYANDVWYSSDGANWTQATAHAAFSPRSSHCALVYENKMWVFGGQNGDGFVEPGAWTSTDGVNWTPAENYVLSTKISHHAAEVYGGQIWVIGGKNPTRTNNIYDWHWDRNDFYAHSYQGIGDVTRYLPATVVFNNKIWIIGGWNGGAHCLGDVWNIE